MASHGILILPKYSIPIAVGRMRVFVSRLIFQMTLLILQSPLHLRLIKVLMMNQAVSTILIMIGDSLQQTLSFPHLNSHQS